MSHTYIAIIEKDEDSAFGIRFPDVPGCYSAADDEEDILKNAIEALELHLEDQGAPQARSLGAIRKTEADALAAGAYLLSVPLVRTYHKQVRANISLDKGILDAIDAAAKLRGMTRSGFIAEAARNEIEGAHKAA